MYKIVDVLKTINNNDYVFDFVTDTDINKNDIFIDLNCLPERKIYKSNGSMFDEIKGPLITTESGLFFSSFKCKKIIATMDKSLGLPLVPTSFINKYNISSLIKEVNILYSDTNQTSPMVNDKNEVIFSELKIK